MKKKLLLLLLIPICGRAMDLRTEGLQVAQIALGGVVASQAYNITSEWLFNMVDSDFNGTLNCQKPWEKVSSYVEKRGLLGLWWVGVPLIAAARIGSQPMDAAELIKPVVITYGATAAVSLVAGMVAYAKGASKENGKQLSIGTASLTSFFAGLATPTTLVGYILYKRFGS